jgi:hypothetical protein
MVFDPFVIQLEGGPDSQQACPEKLKIWPPHPRGSTRGSTSTHTVARRRPHSPLWSHGLIKISLPFILSIVPFAHLHPLFAPWICTRYLVTAVICPLNLHSLPRYSSHACVEVERFMSSVAHSPTLARLLLSKSFFVSDLLPSPYRFSSLCCVARLIT